YVGVVVKNHRKIIRSNDIVVGQTVITSPVSDLNIPGAVGYVQRIIAVGVGVHLLTVVQPAYRCAGIYSGAGNGVAVVVLEPSGDVIGGENTGEILEHGLACADVRASVVKKVRQGKDIIRELMVAVGLHRPGIVGPEA